MITRFSTVIVVGSIIVQGSVHRNSIRTELCSLARRLTNSVSKGMMFFGFDVVVQRDQREVQLSMDRHLITKKHPAFLQLGCKPYRRGGVRCQVNLPDSALALYKFPAFAANTSPCTSTSIRRNFLRTPTQC